MTESRSAGRRLTRSALFSALFYETAGDPAAAAAQRLRLIGIIVPAFVDHQRASLNILQRQAGSHDRLVRHARRVDDDQDRKIAEMSGALGAQMLARACRVEVSARGEPGSRLAIVLPRSAVGVLMDMEAMLAGRQTLEVGFQNDPVCRLP